MEIVGGLRTCWKGNVVGGVGEAYSGKTQPKPGQVRVGKNETPQRGCRKNCGVGKAGIKKRDLPKLLTRSFGPPVTKRGGEGWVQTLGKKKKKKGIRPS